MIQQFSLTKRYCSLVSFSPVLQQLLIVSVSIVGCVESARQLPPSFIGNSLIGDTVLKPVCRRCPIHLDQHTNIDIDLMNYDFSSKQGWDDFYQQSTGQGEEIDKEPSASSTASLNPFQFEWHASIDPSTILSSLCFPTELNNKKNVLLVGNGNSDLPKVIHDHFDGRIKIVCLDYSQPCIDMLRVIYNDQVAYNNMEFICGDATKLESCIQNYYHNDDNSDAISFDYIIDKGLIDAMMCNEGWNASLEKYFQGISALLQSGEGKFILVSYKLSTSTKEYLSDLGEKFGFSWEFHIADKSNDRVSFSIGKKL